MASWFSRQWHVQTPAVGSIAQVEEICKASEAVPCNDTSCIDVVAVCHEFTDHCHKQTLLEVNPSVPVLATTKAAVSTSSFFTNQVMLILLPVSYQIMEALRDRPRDSRIQWRLERK